MHVGSILIVITAVNINHYDQYQTTSKAGAVDSKLSLPISYILRLGQQPLQHKKVTLNAVRRASIK